MAETNIDALLAHSGWVRALAASLARDPGLADDIVQETWISVLRRGPRDGRSPRGWLATLLRRHLRQVRRGEERRSRREEEHARELAQASTADLVERAESHRNLVQAVLDLREPFRSTVLLRYLEERTPEEIAALMGVPVPTVHSRLGRGLAALRARLRNEEDGMRSLLGSVLWLRVGRPRAALRAVLEQAPALVLLAAVASVALLGTWGLLAREPGPPAVSETGTRALATGAESSAVEEDLSTPSTTTRRIATGVVPHARARTAEPGEPVFLHGRVLDREGQALAGVEVAVESPDGERTLALCRSASDGEIRFPVPPEPALVRARDARWETVYAAAVGPGRRGEVALVVAPGTSCSGRVVASDGTPLAGVELALWLDPYVPVNTALALDSCRSATSTAASDAAGRFRFERLPALREALLRVSHPGYRERHVGFAEARGAELEIVLQRPAEARVVRGVVRDELGQPAAGALVSAAPARTTADEHGRFELVLAPAPEVERIVAVKSGEGAVAHELERDPSGAVAWPEWLELALSAEDRAVTGHVLDARGQPVRGARVWLADPTLVGRSGRRLLHAEPLRAAVDGTSRWVESDASGAFRLAGLFEREYRLRALDPRDLVVAEASVRPGDDVTLELRGERAPELVSGRAVDSRGQPLAGAKVELARTLSGATLENVPCYEGLSLPAVITDADGRFALGPCAVEETLLRLESDEILPAAFALSDFASLGGLELVGERRAHFRVELAPPLERADAIEMLAADGAQVFMAQVREEETLFYPRAPLVGGRSLVLAVADTARTLVLYKGGQEAGRLPVLLREGELTVLSW